MTITIRLLKTEVEIIEQNPELLPEFFRHVKTDNDGSAWYEIEINEDTDIMDIYYFGNEIGWKQCTAFYKKTFDCKLK